MKRRHNAIAALLAGTLCAGAVSGVSARAEVNPRFTDTIPTPPGFVQVDDGGLLHSFLPNGEMYPAYFAYQQIEGDQTQLYLIQAYRFNCTRLAVPAAAYPTYAAMYGMSGLDFDNYTAADYPQAGLVMITMFDVAPGDGLHSSHPGDYPNREQALVAFVQELYANGAVESATYAPFYTASYQGQYNQNLLVTGVEPGEERRLAQLAQEYDENVTVIPGDSGYTIAGVEDLAAAAAICSALEAAYPGAAAQPEELFLLATMGATRTGTSLMPVAEDPIDPAAPAVADLTPDYTPGDLDGDGLVTIRDAEQALRAYANMAAGLADGLTEPQRLVGDVDGDGIVTLQDAHRILRYYADDAAGLAASWDGA